MDVTRVFCILLVTSLMDNILFDLAVQSKVPQTTISYDKQHGVRSSKEMKASSNNQGLDLSPDLKTTGQKWSTDEYRTLSSEMSSKQNAAVVNSPVTTEIDIYPILTTDSPSFVTRSRNVRNPHAVVTPGGYREEIDLENDRPQYPIGHNIVTPKWTRYHSGKRHLKNYGPPITESDTSMDSSNMGPGYNNNYDSTVSYGSRGHDNYYEPENYYKMNSGYGMNSDHSVDEDSSLMAGDEVANWYNGHPVVHLPRPSHAKIKPSSNKITFSLKNLGTLAAIKIGLFKLKLLAAFKFFALLIIKLKVIAMVAFFAFVKFAVISKLFKFFVFPFLPDVFTWLRNAMMMQMNPMMNMMPMMQSDPGNGGQFRNMSIADSVTNHKRSTNTNAYHVNRLITSVQLAKCVEQMACHTAGTVPRIFQSMWFYWITSSLINYIPNKKLKLYVSTFRDVSDYRLRNIFSNLTTAQWLEWCDDQYSCKEDAPII